ncbi:MAG: hypothetical protein AAGC83_13950 [Pseudomonadota bacterium]
MTQILFTIAVVVIVLYGARAVSTIRNSRGRASQGKGEVAPRNSTEDLVPCPICGVYSIGGSRADCAECNGKPRG